MKQTTLHRVFIAVFVLVFLLLFMLVAVFLVLVVERKEDNASMTNTLREYKLLLQDHVSNTTLSGITTQSEIISEKGYVYTEGERYSILVSEFGSTEFECEGMCYCENENSGRRGSMSLGRSFSILVAAVSSILAFEYAEEYFGNMCKEKLKEECNNLNVVRSKVDSCDNIIDYPHRKQEEAEYGKFYEEYGSETIIYWCKGHCLANTYNQELDYPIGYMDLKKGRNFDSSPQTDRERELALAHGCENFEFQTEIWIDLGHEGGWSPFLGKETEEGQIDAAKDRFLHEFMEPFCLRQKVIEGSTILCGHEDWDTKGCFKGVNILREFSTEQVEKMCLKDCDKGIRSKFPLCVAHDNAIHLTRGDVENDNESVVCRKMVKRTSKYRKQILEKGNQNEKRITSGGKY